MLPDFDERGFLPPGEHPASWEEVRARFGGNPRREGLLEGMAKAIALLRAAQCPRVWLDGSFVTTKPEPGDFDVCYDRCDVSLLDQRLYPVFGLQRREQKRDFGGELFPADSVADVEPDGTPIPYRKYFQRDRSRPLKGIVVLDLEKWQ